MSPTPEDQSEVRRIIAYLGGTSAVAALFSPPIAPSAVSQWMRAGKIPPARRQTLELLRADAFAPPKPAPKTTLAARRAKSLDIRKTRAR